jgi:hypothetical protein
MADANFVTYPQTDTIDEFVANAGVAISIGDLLYQATDDARPATSQADQGTEATNQRLFAKNFIGVANSARTGTEAAAGVVRVHRRLIVEYPCQSATFEIGDLVAASENGDGDGLLAQKVEKVTSKDLAIGIVRKRYASATTTVLVELFSRVHDQPATKINPGTAMTTQLTSLTHTAPGTPDYAIQDLINSNAYGFVTKDEGNTVLSVILNLQARMAEVEALLRAHGIVV